MNHKRSICRWNQKDKQNTKYIKTNRKCMLATNQDNEMQTNKNKTWIHEESGWWTVLRIGNYPVWIQDFHLHTPQTLAAITSSWPWAVWQHAVVWVVGRTRSATHQMVNREAMQRNISLKIAFTGSQSIHAECVLSGRVGENHVRVVEHVQSV